MSPRNITATIALKDREYDPGKSTFDIDSVTPNGLITSDLVDIDATLSGQYINAGRYDNVTVSASLSGEKAYCYHLEKVIVNEAEITPARTYDVIQMVQLSNRKAEIIEKIISELDSTNYSWIYNENDLRLDVETVFNDIRYVIENTISMEQGRLSFSTNAVDEVQPIQDIGKIIVHVSGANIEPYDVVFELNSENSTNPSIYAITVQHNDKGTVNPNNTVFVNEGDNQSFNLSPLKGYQVASVSVDGVQLDPVKYESGTVTLENVTADHVLNVQFELIPTETDEPSVEDTSSSDNHTDEVGTWDDGGPFTTDSCGSVYDRWGNLIYQGTCGVSTGFLLVNTSDK